MTDKSLNQRIQSAIKAGASAGIECLISEARAAVTQADALHDTARDRALDPLLSEDEVAAARRAMEDAKFTRERMEKAAAVLKDKLKEFQANEQEAERTRIYDAALKKRDAVAAHLRTEYPELANRLGALFADVVAADGEVEQANRCLPSHGKIIQTVERHARKMHPHEQRFLAYMTIHAFEPTRGPVWGKGELPGSGWSFNPDTANAETVSSPTGAASQLVVGIPRRSDPAVAKSTRGEAA